MIITVDGQSSSGKSSLACGLAKELGYHFLGSGSIYRLLAYAKLEGHDLDQYIQDLSQKLRFEVEQEMKVFVGDQDMTVLLHNNDVTQMASKIAKDGEIRKMLLSLQKNFDQPPGLVAEGRDMGTVVFPQAKIKFFLLSDIRIRAKRRVSQLKEMGIEGTLENEMKWLEERDDRDRSRALSPLVMPEGAHVIDTSEGSKEENLQKMLDCVNQAKDC